MCFFVVQSRGGVVLFCGPKSGGFVLFKVVFANVVLFDFRLLQLTLATYFAIFRNLFLGAAYFLATYFAVLPT